MCVWVCICICIYVYAYMCFLIVDTQIVPNAVFHYDISPFKVVVQEQVRHIYLYNTSMCGCILYGYIHVYLIRLLSRHADGPQRSVSL